MKRSQWGLSRSVNHMVCGKDFSRISKERKLTESWHKCREMRAEIRFFGDKTDS